MADVRSVTEDILRRAGLPRQQVETAQLAGPLPGLVLGERQGLARAVEELQAVFQFDVVTMGGKLTFRPRGQQVVRVVDRADLVPDREGELLRVTRTPDAELPEELNLLFLDKATDYQAGVQTALRQVGRPATRRTVRTGMVLDAGTAKVQAEILLNAAFAEKFRLRFRLGPRHLAVEPGDVMALVMPDRQWVVRVLETLFRDGVVEVKAVTTDPAAYQQTAPVMVDPGPRPVVLAGLSTLVLLDLPLETDDAGPVLFVAVGKARNDAAWQYAALYQVNPDASVDPVQVVTREAITGVTAGVLPPGPVAFWDDAATVTVTVDDGQLFSVTDAEVLNGANTAVIGNEVVQFARAVLVAPATYRLERLLRGRRGTEVAVEGHQAGERFVLLGPEIGRLPVNLEILGNTLSYKAVSSGGLVGDAPTVATVPQGVNLRPLSPVHLTGTRAGDGGLTVRWIRRTRIAGGWNNGADVPLGEESERYVVEVMDGATVKRAWEVVAPVAVYPAAEQVTDFGAVQGSVSVRVAQVSSVVGRGAVANATV